MGRSVMRAAPVVPAAELEAESAILGAILLEGRSALQRVALHVDDFYLESHREIYRAMLALDGRGEPVDALTLSAELRRAGTVDVAGGPTTLALLMEHASIHVYLPSYAALIVEAARRREFHALGERLRTGSLNGASAADLAKWAGDLLAEHRTREARQRHDEAPSELTALLAHRFPPRPSIIGRGILPRPGILVNGGAPKTGKTLAIGNLLLQRARGRPWLGFPTDPGVSLVVQSEISASAVADRFRVMLGDDPEPVPEGRLHIKTRRGVMLDEPAGLAQIMAWLEETGADLLCVDPLARHMSGDENSNRDMSAVVRAVDSLIECYGVSIILVHHPSKPKDGEPRTGGMRLRGASALFGAADTVVMMDRTDDGFALSFDLRHDVAPDAMRLTRTEDLWLVPAGPDPELLTVATITAPAPLPYSALVGAVGHDLNLSKATAKRRVAAALAAGMLAKDVDGLYRPGSAYHRAGSQSHEVSADA